MLFLKCPTIFSHRWMTVKSQHRLCLTFLLPFIPYTTLFFWEDSTIGLGVNGKALDWFKSHLTGRSQRIKLGNCLSSKSDLSFGLPTGQFLVLCFLHSIPLHSVAWFQGILSLIISMLMIASCIFPFHQATLLQHWMVYNRAWPLSSPGCWQINWNWTQIKLNSSSLGMNSNGANIFLCFL